MRRIILLLLNLIFPTICFCQPVIAEPVDSLRKYSYFIFGTEDGYYNTSTKIPALFITGTCFFIKSRQHTFLVSAKHVLTSWDPVQGAALVHYPDTLYVQLKEKKSGNNFLYPFYIKPIKDTITGAYLYNDPDVFLIEVKDADKYDIHSIDKYLTANIPDSAIQKTAFLYGYPKLDGRSIEQLADLPAIQTKIFLTSKLTDVLDLGENRYDALNYRASILAGNYKTGSSGSPVFFKMRNNKYWLFGGLASSFDKATDKIMIVKPNDVLAKLIALVRE